MSKPNSTLGLRHLALYVSEFEATLTFYKDLIGMQVEWSPDDDNIYLSSGVDNLALHRVKEGAQFDGPQRLDHLGFILAAPEDVDDWYAFLANAEVSIVAPPKTHRDGARSFYCKDPDGNIVQLIYHPPISGLFLSS